MQDRLFYTKMNILEIPTPLFMSYTKSKTKNHIKSLTKKQKQIFEAVVCDYALSRELAMRSLVDYITRKSGLSHELAIRLLKSPERAEYIDGWAEEMDTVMKSQSFGPNDVYQACGVTFPNKAKSLPTDADRRIKGSLANSPMLRALLEEEQRENEEASAEMPLRPLPPLNKTEEEASTQNPALESKKAKIKIGTKIKPKNKNIWTVFVDGSVRVNTRICTVAGVLRSPSKGRAAIKFKRQVEYQTVDMTEFQALYEALRIARRYKVKKLRLYGDSLIALEYMTKIHRNMPVEHIKNAAKIKRLMNDFEFVEFIRCRRDMVQEAHNLCYELGEKLEAKARRINQKILKK